jgi:hypothetical protein
MSGTLCLLNNESVANEILELARLRIVDVLKVTEADVVARWDLNESTKRIVPAFDVNMDAAQGLTEFQVRSVLAKAYGDLKHELTNRLVGLKERRVESTQ